MTPPLPPHARGRSRRLLVWAGIAAALALAAAWLAFILVPHERERFVTRWRDQLVAVASDRSAAVETWVWGRFGDARTVAAYPSVVALAAAPPPVGSEPGPGGDSASHLTSVLTPMTRNYGYLAAGVVAADGRVLVEVGEGRRLGPTELEVVRRCVSARRDLAVFRVSARTRPVVEFLTPVLSESGSAPSAAVVLVADPETWLYRFLRLQPVVSESAETLLVAGDGDSVVFLSPLRHAPGAPLSLHLPLSTAGLAAGAALTGRTEFAEYVDYRGVPVLAVTRQLKGTSWGMVVKVDREEVLRPYRAWLAGALTLLASLVLALGAVGYAVWRRQKLGFDLALAQSHARLAELVDYANDAIVFFARDGRVRDANRLACETYGYTKEELKALTVADLRSPVARPGAAAAFDEVARVGRRTYETVHVRRDGTEFPVEASLRYVVGPDEEWVIAIIRDISERRAAEARTRRLNLLLRTVSEINQLVVRERDRETLAADACRVIVEHGEFTMAWIGFADETTGLVVPAARAGTGVEYLDTITVRCDDSEHGRGPTGTAIRERRWVVANDWATDPRLAAWREAGRRHEFRASAAFPLVADGVPPGALSVYSAQPDAFDGEIVALLDELARNIAFALGSIAVEEAHAAASAALRESEREYRLLAENASDVIWVLDVETRRFRYVSPSVERLRGYTVAEVLAQELVQVITPASLGRMRALVKERLLDFQGGARRTYTDEIEQTRRDGSSVWTETTTRFMRNEETGHVEMYGASRDIGERKRTQEALRESEEELRTLADTTTTGILIHAGEEFLYANAAAATITGFATAELLTMKFWEVVHPDARDLVRARGLARLAGDPDLPTQYETKLITKSGGACWVNLTSGAIPLRGRRALVVTVYDITKERRLRDLQAAIYDISEATSATRTLDDLFRSIHAIIGRLMDARNFYIALYDRATNLVSFPYTVDESDADEPPRPPKRGLTEYVLRTGQPLLATPETFDELSRRGEVELVGTPSIDWLGVPLISGDRVIGVLVVQTYAEGVRYGEEEEAILTFVSRQVAQAIEHKRAEGAVRESEERYRQLVELSPDAVAVNCGGRYVFVNPAAVRLFGAESGDDIIGRPVLDLVHPDFRDAVRKRIEQTLADGSKAPALEEKFIRLDGTPVDVEVVAGPMTFEGRPAVLVAFRDLTERFRLEEQLRQSQKMEAVGRLAGGIAHDFNNVLQVMLSRTELLRSRAVDAASVAAAADELEQHLRRGASLTRQLLLFSRRETVKPEHLDLNEVVSTASELLRRLIQENVSFSLELAGGVLPVRADRGQLDQVLMNLAVNASHAMPEGGRLVVRTGRDGPDRVWFEMQDTGHGIPEEVRAHIFEPFFTTKERGGGTGLGLSVVHGIITLHGGRISVESGVGAGTSFRVELPRAAASGAPGAGGRETAAPGLPLGHGERVLLVEDETGARAALADILASLGYSVTAAESGEVALALPADPPFDLLLTDLMLPGLTGSALARRLATRWPLLKVIVMSGYAEDDALRREIAAGALRFLQKPFDMASLARELERAFEPGAAS